MKEKSKVIAYIIREKYSSKEVLVFDHKNMPEAGTQVVGGTVDPGEELKTALVREIYEESGLNVIESDLKYIGESVYFRKDFPEKNLRTYFLIDGNHLPNSWSHQVISSGEDNNLVFDFYWVSLSIAKVKLVGNFQEYLEILEINSL